MKNTLFNRRTLEPPDRIAIAYLSLILLILLAYRSQIPAWGLKAGIHALLLLGIAALAAIQSRRPNRLWTFLRSWDAVVYIPISFMQIISFIHLVHPHDYDTLLQSIDNAIGGDRLLRWTMTWTTRGIDEIGKVIWVFYYFLPLLPAISLYRKNRAAFLEVKTALVLGWTLSYLGYFLIPALGPLHFKEQLGLTDPSSGIFLAGPLKEAIYSLEGEARDTFPSGHALIAALVIWISVHHRLRIGWCAIPLSLGVLASTLTLRYHYVIDVVAGVVLAILCAILARKWFQKNPGLATGVDDKAGSAIGSHH